MKEKVFTSSCFYGWQPTENGHMQKTYQRYIMQFDNKQEEYIKQIEVLADILGIPFNDLIGSSLEITVTITRLNYRNYFTDGTSEIKPEKEEWVFDCKGVQKNGKLCEYCLKESLKKSDVL